MVVPDPIKFLLRMGIRMHGKRTMRFIHQGFPGPVKLLVPSQERRFGYVISSDDESNPDSGAVEFYGMKFCVKFMWQISL